MCYTAVTKEDKEGVDMESNNNFFILKTNGQHHRAL